MNYGMIRYILSSVFIFEGGFLLLPCLVALIYGESEGYCYLLVMGICISLGAMGRIRKVKNRAIYTREGYVAVSLSWILISLLGALPFYLTGEIPHYIDALFETISGFTTTGASILSDVEQLSYASAFWRCFTHWIGGMGVLVLVMAILPISGSYNMNLMRAESPGPSVGKLVPKVKSTAMILYGIYIMITLTEVIALMLAGLSPFTALTLTFSTVGTGGFALLNSSIGSYSMVVQTIIIVFMLLCAVNFGVFYLLLKKKPREALASEELHWFLAIVFGAAILITINIRDGFDSLFRAFHTALFQVASIITTTGFATADFDKWPEFSKAVLLGLMFIGACAGSTGGGLKVSRLMLLLRSAKDEIVRVSHPRSVRKVLMNGRMIPNNIVRGAHCYLVIYVGVVLVSFLLVSLDGFETTVNFTAVMTTLNNVGPGFGRIGPTGNFGDYGVLSKLILMFDMLIGRLELYPLLILFYIPRWKNK